MTILIIYISHVVVTVVVTVHLGLRQRIESMVYLFLAEVFLHILTLCQLHLQALSHLSHVPAFEGVPGFLGITKGQTKSDIAALKQYCLTLF